MLLHEDLSHTVPTYYRAFASFIILHKGKRTISGMEMPSPFKHAKLPNYGGLALHFVKPQAEFVVEYEDENVAAKPIFARMPLHAQKPGSKVYRNVENMCRVRCEQTGEEGLTNVEIGALVDA